jgi:CubicO group peptidase (beta-lactamase class C family)
LGATAAGLRAAALPRSSPEAQGLSSAGVRAFVEAADRGLDSLHGFMLVRHGHVVAEGWRAPYDAASPHALYSLSKSFTSAAIGIAAGEGKLGVDDPVLKFFPDDPPAQPGENLKSMRVGDLLRMSTLLHPWPSVISVADLLGCSSLASLASWRSHQRGAT